MIQTINDLQSHIAQSGGAERVMKSIGRTVVDAAKATGEIATNITGMAQEAAEAAKGSENVRAAAERLAGMSASCGRWWGSFGSEGAPGGGGRHLAGFRRPEAARSRGSSRRIPG